MVSIRGEKKYYPVEPPLYMDPKFWVSQTDPSTGATMREKAIVHAKGNPNSKAAERCLSAKEEEIWSLIGSQLDSGVEPCHATLWRQWGKETGCTLADCLERLCSGRGLSWREGSKGGTAADFRSKFAIIQRFSPNVLVTAINVEWVRSLYAWMLNEAVPMVGKRKGYAKNTCTMVISVLSILLNQAIEDGYIRENAVTLYKKSKNSASMKIIPAVPHPLSEDDVERLQAVWDAGGLKPLRRYHLQLVLVSVYTGLRWSDLQQLYDPTKFQLTGDHLQLVSKKTQKPLRILVTKRLASVLCKRPDGKLLLGEAKQFNHASKVLRSLLAALGMERKIVWHDLRKTAVSIMYARTGDLNAVSKAVGHSNVAVTEAHYLKTASSQIDRAMASMDEIGTDRISVSAIDILHEVAAMVTSNPSIRVTPRMADLLRKHCGVETGLMMRAI